MEFQTSLENFDSNMWGYYLPVPAELAKQFIDGKDRRIKCLVNQKLLLHCALMPSKDGFFIMMNKPNVTKLGLKLGDKVSIAIEKDHSEYGLPMPESFQTLLDQDEAGNKYFHELTPGKQRNLIYIVSQVKNIDSQLNKGLAILDHLKSSAGKLNFKVLMETIKSYNQRSKLK